MDVKLAINRLLEGLFCFLSSCETNQKMLSPPEILGEKMPVGGDFFGSHFVFSTLLGCPTDSPRWLRSGRVLFWLLFGAKWVIL